MFSRIHEYNRWNIERVVKHGIDPATCVELNLPVRIWRILAGRPDGLYGALEPKAETWEFKYDLQEDEYALVAVYKEEFKPVVFLTSPALYRDFDEWLTEGLDLMMPAFAF